MLKTTPPGLTPCYLSRGVLSVPEIASQVGLSKQRVVEALALLADSGQVGFDVTNSSYFHRPLPVKDTLEAMHPRLAGRAHY